MTAMAAYIDELIDMHSVSWEWLASEGYVDPVTIAGMTDPRWLVGDDVIMAADEAVCLATGAERVSTSADGLYLE